MPFSVLEKLAWMNGSSICVSIWLRARLLAIVEHELRASGAVR